MADLDKGGSPFEYVYAYFGPSIGWTKAQLVPTVTPPTQPTVITGGGTGLPLGPTTVTMSSGAVTATSTYLLIDTGGPASSDLTTVNGVPAGQTITLAAANASRAVVVKQLHTLGVGNLIMSADFTLGAKEPTVTFISDGTMLYELSSSANAIPAAMLPSGAAGIWYADQATVANGNPVVPNVQSAVPASQNIWRAPRRLFSDSQFWQSGGVVFVESSAVGPDGKTQATKATCTGGWLIQPFDIVPNTSFINYPAGTYTVGINVQSATGSNQSFVFGLTGANAGSNLTATTSWQRFSHTFTFGSTGFHQLSIMSIDGVTGATINICDFECFEGSSDLGPEVLGGHMCLGGSAFSGPTVGGGYIDFSAGTASMALIQLPAPVSVNTFTSSFLVNTVHSFASPQHAILAEANGSTSLTLYVQFNTTTQPIPEISFNNRNSLNLNIPFAPLRVGPHVMTFRYDGTLLEIFWDDIRIIVDNTWPGLAATPIANLLVAMEDGFAPAGADKISAVGIWPRALSNTELYTVVDIFMNRFKAFYSVSLQKNIYCAEGDSITAGYSDGVNSITTYPSLYAPLSGHTVMGGNTAESGDILAQMVSRGPGLLASLPPAGRRVGRNFILGFLIGTNDSLADPTAYAASVGSYVDSMNAGGFNKVLTGTLMSTAPLPAAEIVASFNARTTYNGIIKGAWGHGQGIMDFAGNANLGAYNAASNSTYFMSISQPGGGVHPTAAGQSIMETIAAATIDPLLI